MKKKEMMKWDLVLMLVWPILASLISFLIKPNAFFSVIIFFGIPSIYLSFRAKECIKKSTIFSLIIGLPLIFIIDYIAHITGTWNIPSSIIDFRFLNIITVEVLIWAILYVYFIIIFYEYFLDKHIKKENYTKNIKYLIIIVLVLLGLFFAIFITNPSYLKIPYFYLIFGTILGFLPLVFVLLKFPKLYSKFFKTTAYFFFLSFATTILLLHFSHRGL